MTGPVLWESGPAEAATGGRSSRPWRATGVSIDSRTLRDGDLFVAIRGPSLDGHAFVEAAFAAGAAAAVVSTPPDRAAGPVLVVDDTLEALNGLARAARRRAGARVAAVTGSVGKTSVKEALAHVLGAQGETAASERSLNNCWGVPLSLARMRPDAVFGVFEIGMSSPGEIVPLAALAAPRVAVVTAIGPAHMAYFDSLEAIARAKAEIFTGLRGGTAVINLDAPFHELLANAAHDAGAGEIIGFGSHPDADLRLIAGRAGGNGLDVGASWRGEPLEFRVGQPAAHWARNALAVLCAVHGLGAGMREAAAALATLPALPGRGMIHTLRWGDGELRLVDDSYNANPDSMRAALDTLGGMAPAGGRRIAVLGDMLELGDASRQAHADLGADIERNAIDLVHLVGREMRALAGRLDADRLGLVAGRADDIVPGLLGDLRGGDIVTVKASNAVGLSRIVDAVLETAGPPDADAGQPKEASGRAL